MVALLQMLQYNGEASNEYKLILTLFSDSFQRIISPSTATNV
jgi:hypothetical protein